MERFFSYRKPLLLSLAFGAFVLGGMAWVLGQRRLSFWAFGAGLGLVLVSFAVE